MYLATTFHTLYPLMTTILTRGAVGAALCTTNSMPCCCRRTCSYGLQVLLALEWDTNPTRDIEMRPQEGPSSPCARSAAALSF